MSGKNENTNPKRYTHPNVHCSTIYNSQDMETTKCPSTEVWIKNVVPIYNVILLSHKKERSNVICSNLDGPSDYHTKWSKSDRERQISYDITPMWNPILKNYTNELIYKTETDSQISKTNLWLPKGKHGKEG